MDLMTHSPTGSPMNGPHEILQDSDVQALISYLEHESAPMIVMNTNYDILADNTAYQREFGVAGTPYVGRKC